MNPPTYVASRRAARLDEPPDDWQERLARLPDLTVLARTPARVEFTASTETLARIRSEFGDALIVEPLLPRGPVHS